MVFVMPVFKGLNVLCHGVYQEFKIETPENWSEYMDLLEQLKSEHGKLLPLLSAALAKLESLSDEERQSRLEDIVAAANDVIKAIDRTKLACFLAEKCPEDGKGMYDVRAWKLCASVRLSFSWLTSAMIICFNPY